MPEDDADVVLFLLIADGAVEVRLVLFFFQKLVQAVVRGCFGDDHGAFAHAGGVLPEDVSHVLRLDVRFHGVVVVADNFADVALLHVLLELTVRDFLRVQPFVACKHQKQQHQGYDGEHPVQVELRHVRLVGRLLVYIFLVHTSVNRGRGLRLVWHQPRESPGYKNLLLPAGTRAPAHRYNPWPPIRHCVSRQWNKA